MQRQTRARCLSLCLLVTATLAGCGPHPPQHLVIVSLDTVRRDHASAYGYERPTTPALEKLARRAVVFDNAFAQDTNTSPSHASMFTGLYPHVHGSQWNGHLLAPEKKTLAEILEALGFRTAAFISGAPLQAAASGLDQGFQLYDDAFEGRRRDGRIATENAIRWLRSRQPGQRYFLFLHLWDAHGPYRPPASYRPLFASHETPRGMERIPLYQMLHDQAGREIRDFIVYRDRYDAAIRYDDDLVARLLAELDLDRTLLVVLADHGETLDERFHGLDHGGQVFDEQIRIPLLLAAPGMPARRLDALVETVDLLPTLLELLGCPPPEEVRMQGTSLVPLLNGKTQLPRRVVFSSARADSDRHADRGYRLDEGRKIHSVRSQRWKLINYPGRQQDYFELYDLRLDPGESRNLFSEKPHVAERLRSLLERWHAHRYETIPEPDLPARIREELEALGYLD